VRVIAITNQKGGSGKTTTAVNLAATLAERKRKVLVIDLDSQASASSWFGMAEEGQGLLEVLTEDAGIGGQVYQTGIDRVSLVPASSWLIHAEKTLAGEPGAEVLLRKKMETLDGWDYILIDCPPALGILTSNALCAAGEVLVPVEASFMALAGLAQLLHTINVVKDRLNPDLEVCGILACRVDRRTSHALEVVDILKGRFGSIFINVPVRENVRLRECPSFQQSIIDYSPKSAGAEDYRTIAKVIIRQERKHGKKKNRI